MKRSSSRTTQREHVEESASILRDAAKDLVLNAARLWRERKGIAWSARILVSSLDVLTASEAVLGEVLDGETVAPAPNGRPRH